MADMLEPGSIAEHILAQKYEMDIIITQDEGILKEQDAVKIEADGIVEKAANGLVKIRLTNLNIKVGTGTGALRPSYVLSV